MIESEFNIFIHDDYVEVLRWLLERDGKRSGLKTKLSASLGVKSSHLSRILSHESDLTPEQGYEVALFFHMTELETDYFINLINFSRAGTHRLNKVYSKNMRKLKEENSQLKSRLGKHKALEYKYGIRYYSRWIFMAIHIGISIPNLRTVEKIAERFKLSIEEASDIISFLEEAGLVGYDHYKKEHFLQNNVTTYIEKTSPLSIQNHFNWHLKALEKISSRDQRNVHICQTLSVSKEDALQLKNNIMEHVQKTMDVVGPSKEEVIYCQLINFFEV